MIERSSFVRAEISSARHRLAMTRLAVRGNRAFQVSAIEIEADVPSYTVHTLRRLHAAAPSARWFLVIGADSLDEFHTWRDPDAIVAYAEHPIPVARAPAASASRYNTCPTMPDSQKR